MKTVTNKQFNDVIQNAAKASGITTAEAHSYLKGIVDNATPAEMACALAHFCFRNGPVEDMHAEGKLSDEDMKILNKYCHDKLFTFLCLLEDGELEKFATHLFLFKNTGWDEPEFRLYDASN